MLKIKSILLITSMSLSLFAGQNQMQPPMPPSNGQNQIQQPQQHNITQAKSQALQNINAHISILQSLQSCINSSNTHQDMQSCHKQAQNQRQKVELENIESRKQQMIQQMDQKENKIRSKMQ